MARNPPSAADLLEALAAGFSAGATLDETLSLIARAGPASARQARVLSERLRAGSLAEALSSTRLIAREEAAVMALAGEVGRLPRALAWAAERARLGDARRRAIRRAVLGPFVFIALSLAAEKLMPVIVGGASTWTFLRSLVVWSALAAVAVMIFPALVAKILGRRGAEATAAGLVALFAEANQLGAAPQAARGMGAQIHADALTAVAADPGASVPVFSEPFALALQVGIRAADLPQRLEALRKKLDGDLTARLRSVARLAVFALLAGVALHGLIALFSTPLPGLGNSPELKDLERELENLGN